MGTTIKRIALISVLLFFLSPLKLAFSNADRFSIVVFHPMPDGGEYFSIASSTSLYHLQWNAGTIGDFAYKPLIEKTTSRQIINWYLMQHFYAALGLTDWFSLGFDLPVAWDNHFRDPDSLTSSYTNNLNLSDPRFEMKFRLLDRARYPVGIAIEPFITAPLGKKAKFMGDDGVTGGGILVLDTEIKRRLWLALNAGVQAHRYVTWRNVDQNAVSVLLGLGASLRAAEGFRIAVEVNTKTPTNHFFTERQDTPTELLGGIKYDIGRSGLQINAGGGVGLVSGVGAPLARGFAGISYKSTNERTISKDRDREQMKYVELKDREQRDIERIIALRDRCPSDPSKFRPGVDDEGCPKYYELKEVADLVTKCPSRAEKFDPRLHSMDCMKVYTLTDNYGQADAEAVYILSNAEMAAKCPKRPSDFNPKVHDQGCPKYYELKDASSLIASCPTDPKKFNPKVHDEACPKVYELKDTYQEENWMTIARLARKNELIRPLPPAGGVKITGEEIVTKVPITFKFNSYEITDESAAALGELAEKLISDPKLKHIRIEGYADPVGGKAMNKVYSQRRAEAVKRYLELHGVDVSEMKITAFGPSTKFPGGYPANRRVIFLLEK